MIDSNVRTHTLMFPAVLPGLITHPADVMDVLEAARVAQDVVTAGAIGFKHWVARRELRKRK